MEVRQQLSGHGYVRQMRVLLTRWWSGPFEYEWFPDFLKARGLLGLARLGVLVWCAGFFLLTLFVQCIPSGALDPTERFAAVLVSCCALYCIVRWQTGRQWPHSGESGQFILVMNIAFATTLIGGAHSPLVGGVASTLYAVLALYVAVFHSPRALVGQLAGACLVSALAAVHALSVSGAETSFVVIAMVTTWCVAASTSLTWQFVLLYLTVEARNASKDPLTGLLNWRGLRDAQPSLARSAHGQDSVLIAMVIDLDDFKVLNDVHGHRAGDQALRSVSERLTNATGAAGLVARIGGDEFVVFLLVAREDVESKARDVHSAVFTSKDHHPLRASSGATVLVTDELHAEQIPHREQLDAGHSNLHASTEMDDQPLSTTELIDVMIDHADKAMYRAKKRGGHQLTWSSTFRSSSDFSAAKANTINERNKGHPHAVAAGEADWRMCSI